MSAKPDVRPPNPNHPDPRKRTVADHGDGARMLALKASAHLFEETAANKLRMQRMILKSLDLYELDLERAATHAQPDKFRWRVSPTTAIRLRAELRQLDTELEALREKCHHEAVAALEHVLGQMPPEEQSTFLKAQAEHFAKAEELRSQKQKEAAAKPPIAA